MADGMQRLSTGMDQQDCREFELFDQGILFVNRQGIGFHQRIPEIRHVAVGYALSVQRVKPDPGAVFIVQISQDSPDIAIAGIEGRNQFSSSSSMRALFRQVFSAAVILGIGLRDISHKIIRLEQRFQVLDDFLYRCAVVRSGNFFLLDPALIDDPDAAWINVIDHGIPGQDLPVIFFLSGPESVLDRHLNDRSHGNVMHGSTERIPLFFALTCMIPGRIRAGPCLPYAAGIASLLERHPNIAPFLVCAVYRIYGLQDFLDLVIICDHFSISFSSFMISFFASFIKLSIHAICLP